MKTYKYKMSNQSNLIRLGNLIDDIWQVHKYFHDWQNQRYQEGLPYANYNAMAAPSDGLQTNHASTLERFAVSSHARGVETY